MSLKELTKEKHTAAEKTPFMKAVFKGNMSDQVWADFTYNKMLVYGAIEAKAHDERVMDDLQGIDRAYRLWQDYNEMTKDVTAFPFKKSALDYQQYIFNLEPGNVLAHLYVWHMGDLHGGQMIKKVINAPHRSLEFDNPEELKVAIRNKLNDSLADEANVAFDWAIKLLSEYDNEFIV